MAQLSAQGAIGAPFATSVASTEHASFVGQRMRDTGGNEYVLVTLGETLTAGQWAQYRVPSNALRVAQTTRGPIGIVTADATSGQQVWLQIYGDYATAQVTNSEATSAHLLIAPGGATTEAALVTVSTDAAANIVVGAWITAAASTDTTGSSSAHSGITVAVRLNYPQLTNIDINTTVGSS